MPVPLSSRYARLPIFDAPAPDGEVRATIGIRPSAPLPRPGTGFQHLVTGGETMESIAWRHFGSSHAWWRIADANPLVFPTELHSGAPVVVPEGAQAGRVERTRSF